MSPLTSRILIVDDEIDFAKGIARLLQPTVSEQDIALAHSGETALATIDSFAPQVMLLDLNMPGMDGHTVLREALQKDPTLSIIVLTAHGTVETAVNTLKNGAWDFLTKPVRREDLIRSITKAFERSKLVGENRRLTQLMVQSELSRVLIGESTPMKRLKESIRAVAASNYTVLILGESGTGKELVAESIYRLSERKNKPFVTVNCPAIPEQLLESELFGHSKGAFTGAVSSRKGLFLEAAGGTIVLDEIGDISLPVQTKLLRILQSGEIRPVGSNQVYYTDTRIIAITNQNLQQKIKEATFREDLFYRLNVLSIHTPPLRDRRDDIPLLATHFLALTCRELGIPEKHLSPEAAASLYQRSWQGNVRELQNFMRRVTVFCNGTTVTADHLQFTDAPQERASLPHNTTIPYKEAKQDLVDAFTRQYIHDLLKQTQGNISEAARISGLERVSLQKILRRLAINASNFKR